GLPDPQHRSARRRRRAEREVEDRRGSGHPVTFTPDRFHEFYERPDVVSGYDVRRGRTPALRAVRRRELDFFLGHVRPGASVCEIGAGTGFVTRRLLAQGPVYAVEPSPAMRERLAADLVGAPGLTIVDG